MFNWQSFLSYILLTAFTPGPNNIMAMSTAGRFGFRRSLRFCFGVFLGALCIMAGCAAAGALLLRVVPAVGPVLKYFGAAYILYLAYTIWRDAPHSDNKRTLQPDRVLTGMVLQFVNVKVILYGITSLSAYVLPHYQSAGMLTFFVLLLSGTGFASTCCWALSGSLFQRVFFSHRKALNLGMALLLVWCAVTLVL